MKTLGTERPHFQFLNVSVSQSGEMSKPLSCTCCLRSVFALQRATGIDDHSLSMGFRVRKSHSATQEKMKVKEKICDVLKR